MAFPGPFEGKLEEGSRSILERRIEVSQTSICIPRNLVMFSVAKRGLQKAEISLAPWIDQRFVKVDEPVVVWEVWYYGSGAWCCLGSYDIPYCEE